MGDIRLPLRLSGTYFRSLSLSDLPDDSPLEKTKHRFPKFLRFSSRTSNGSPKKRRSTVRCWIKLIRPFTSRSSTPKGERQEPQPPPSSPRTTLSGPPSITSSSSSSSESSTFSICLGVSEDTVHNNDLSEVSYKVSLSHPPEEFHDILEIETGAGDEDDQSKRMEVVAKKREARYIAYTQFLARLWASHWEKKRRIVGVIEVKWKTVFLNMMDTAARMNQKAKKKAMMIAGRRGDEEEEEEEGEEPWYEKEVRGLRCKPLAAGKENGWRPMSLRPVFVAEDLEDGGSTAGSGEAGCEIVVVEELTRAPSREEMKTNTKLVAH